MKYIKLVGCSRYGVRNRLFQKGEVSAVSDDALAAHLLEQEDLYGDPFFEEVEGLEEVEVEEEEAPKPAPKKKKAARKKAAQKKTSKAVEV